MKKAAILICFIWPLVCSCLNIQLLTATFVSVGISQIIAYSNLLFILLGLLLIKDDIGKLSTTARLWFYFYILYYCFGLLASGVTGFNNPDYSILATIVPIIYFTGFYYFMSSEKYFNLFFKTITLSYVAASFLTIILFKLNYDFDHGGFYMYKLDRAGGVYADANNAALGSILAFVLFKKYFKPDNLTQKIIKICILTIVFYSLVITLSTTGLFVFVLVFILSNYKFFNGIRILFFGVVLSVFYLFLFNLEQYYSYFNLSERQLSKIDNIKNVLTFETDKIDSSGREELVQELLHYVYQKPIMGNGIGFSTFIRGHNTYIGVWADAGIITFIFFIIMLLFYIAKSFKLEINLKHFCFSILVALCVFMLTLQTVINQPYIIVLFAFLGYILDKTNTDKIQYLFNNKNKEENEIL